MPIPKRALDKVAGGLVNTEREILDAVVEYGIEWMDGLIRDSETDDRVRLRALGMAKSFRDYGRKHDAAGVDAKKGEGSKRVQEAAQEEMAARLEAGED